MAQADLFKELLKQVQCNNIPDTTFTQDDLDNVKSCIENLPPIEIDTFQVNPNVKTEPSCVPESNEKVKKIIIEEQKKIPTAIRAAVLKGKIEETRDNLDLIKTHYQARVDFFNQVLSAVEPSTAQYIYWDSEYVKIRAEFLSKYLSLSQSTTDLYLISIISDIKTQKDKRLKALGEIKEDYSNLKDVLIKIGAGSLSGRVPALINQLIARRQEQKANPKITNVLGDALRVGIAYSQRSFARDKSIQQLGIQIDKIDKLSPDELAVSQEINSVVKRFSNQLIAIFRKSETSQVVTPAGIVREDALSIPSRTLAFRFRLIDLAGTPTQLPNVADDGSITEKTEILPIKGNPLLKSPVFNNLNSVEIFNIATSRNSPIADYQVVPGLLYNGITGNSYPGYYKKKANPISLMFTPEERGLTVNASQIDPKLKAAKDAPTSIKENDITLYVANQEKYEGFYETLEKNYPEKEKLEREKIFPAAIKPITDQLVIYAQREVAEIFRSTENASLKLARPLNYTSSPGSNIFTAGTFNYDKLDDQLSTRLTYYKKCLEEVTNRINQCNSEIEALTKVIKENSMDESLITKKIQDIPCFKSPTPEAEANCEAETKKKLGTDPLYIRTINSTNSGLPDFSTHCYWNEFIKSLNKVTILPFPDLTGPPPANTVFRYWPITCFIPAGPAIVLLPIPPVWKKLFVLSTPIGTLVGLLTMPLAPIGIPLPSVYLIYFSPDGSKYMIAAPNIPKLYAPPKNVIIGFEQDNGTTSINPLGLHPTNPYKGQPIKGALTSTLAQNVAIAKSTRLAKIAEIVAKGESLQNVNLTGGPLPYPISINEYINKYLSPEEFMKNIADAKPTSEFDKKMQEVKNNINRQLDKLGEMQTTSIASLKARLLKNRDQETDFAHFNEKINSKKRKLKEKAAQLDPNQLDEKIQAAVKSFEDYFDNIKLGTISFPKNATKLNPTPPKGLMGLIETLEAGSLGDLKIPELFKSLNSQLKSVIRNNVNIDDLIKKKRINLNSQSDVNELKNSLKQIISRSLGYLKGDPVPMKVDLTKTKEEQAADLKAQQETQKTLSQALKSTLVSLSSLQLSKPLDMSRKCCEIKSPSAGQAVVPELVAAFAVITALLNAIIDKISVNDILKIFGSNVKEISADYVPTLIESLIDAIPNVPLPQTIKASDLTSKIISPALSAVSIPSAPNPLHPPAIALVIPLDPLIKPLLKAAISAIITALFRLLQRAKDQLDGLKNNTPVGPASQGVQASQSSANSQKVLNQILTESCGNGSTVSATLTTINSQEDSSDTTNPANLINGISEISVTLATGKKIKLKKLPSLPVDLIAYFHILTGNDLIAIVKEIVNGIFDQIITPISNVASAVDSLAQSLNTYDFNIIEAANPFVNPIKLLKMKIDSLIPPSIKLKMINTALLTAIQQGAFKALEAGEPVLKEVAWLGALALCSVATPATAYKTVSAARLAHPIMNQDDLPPWERLTHKNPLFAIFLDEIAWRGSIYSTGSLIWQTKTPAVLPYTPKFPIIHTSPHLAG